MLFQKGDQDNGPIDRSTNTSSAAKERKPGRRSRKWRAANNKIHRLTEAMLHADRQFYRSVCCVRRSVQQQQSVRHRQLDKSPSSSRPIDGAGHDLLICARPQKSRSRIGRWETGCMGRHSGNDRPGGSRSKTWGSWVTIHSSRGRQRVGVWPGFEHAKGLDETQKGLKTGRLEEHTGNL